MEKISFEGIEDRIGGELTITLEIEGKTFTYKQKFVGVDLEYLIFQEKERKYFASKRKIICYN